VVITGNGGNFCSGADMNDIASEARALPWAGKGGPLHKRLSKPTIAAIEGYASAEGLGLALLCDIRIVDQTRHLRRLCPPPGHHGDGTGRAPCPRRRNHSGDGYPAHRPSHRLRARPGIGLGSRKVANGTTRATAEKLAQESPASRRWRSPWTGRLPMPPKRTM